MARTPRAAPGRKKVETLTHEAAQRRNVPTAELQSVAERLEEMNPMPPVAFPRRTKMAKGEKVERDEDLDPQIVWKGVKIKLTKDQIKQLEAKGEIEIGDAQLVWRGKDRQDWSDLVVNVPPIYIQEKIHPKAIIDDLTRRSANGSGAADTLDLFADFNGLDPDQRTDFYQHAQHWSNRMILGDSLQVMASLAVRESLRGKVQCIYFDPPYGIKFNSNWQVSTQSRDVKDGKQTDISREPEQVKAFRDTWKDGIHSYLAYLRDRLTVMRELLADSGSLFVQIGEENVHRVRSLLDEVFGEENLIAQIAYQKTTGATSDFLPGTLDYILWYGRKREATKYRPLFQLKTLGEEGATRYRKVLFPDGRREQAASDEAALDRQLKAGGRLYTDSDLTSQSMGRAKGEGAASWFPVKFEGRSITPSMQARWKTNETGVSRLIAAGRIEPSKNILRYIRYLSDFPAFSLTDLWRDIGGIQSRLDPKVYVVQTSTVAVERCILMATDPGDLVLDPTCGSGTTATVAEQWGRRWITIDTSRVALALARARIMGSRYAYYYLADSKDGRAKEQEVTGRIQGDASTHDDVRQGFVYERSPHITLKSIVGNAAIDTISETYQGMLDPLRDDLNAALSKTWEEWEVPREAEMSWSDTAKALHAEWWKLRIERQKKIDDSIAKSADVELLYDRPYVDTSKVRVAGPFTVESLSPHRVVPADEEELLDTLNDKAGKRRRTKFVTPPTDFAEMILDHLATAGVHQAEKRDTIKFLGRPIGWPGEYVNAEGRFMEGETERRAAIFIGPEFGTLSRVDLAAAAREANEARFDVLIACAFNFDAHASEFQKLGPLPILKAKMNPDLHMAEDLKNTGKGNLFVVFGEPDIDIKQLDDGKLQVQIRGVDVFDPNTGDIRSNDTKGIAAWFIDTDYNEESFFVRHAYFLGASDPYKSLKAALKAEINEEAWSSLYSDTSRPFARPETNRIAVKVINHFGDEVMKVFSV
ncbi:MAG: site-specific DNA-methyltransferase [Alphaproteobacteria bacterium]|nr:MAG: site-specific DNA-methyltransferase [Alphaproteobacteria bacterium]